MINIESTLRQRYPGLTRGSGRWLLRPLSFALRRLFREQRINHILTEHGQLEGFEFIDRVLEYFDFSYQVRHLHVENIPVSGRLVIVANHPLGALDALALLHLVGRVRRDVKIIANDLLMSLSPMRSLLLPVDVLGGQNGRDRVIAINEWLESEGVVIVFPSGEVSRARPNGVRDTRWRGSFLQMARRSNAPVLPIHLGGANSPLFYGVSMLSKPLAGLLLVGEMFGQRGRTISIRVGQPLALQQIDRPGLSRRARVDLVKRHLYRIAQDRKPLFVCPPAIAHPESRQCLRGELSRLPVLGKTADGKQIVLYDYRANDSLIREIGRLRELTFRQVEEGSGRRRDLDRFDRDYRHIVLWDDQDLELVGAYRLAEVNRLVEQGGLDGVYSQSCFAWQPEAMASILPQALELGRSFVQPRYWGSRSLDYLWYGIGAFLSHNPGFRYLLGTVSISASYPQQARAMLVYFYRRFYGERSTLAVARNPVVLDGEQRLRLNELFNAETVEGNFRILKAQLASQGLAVPTLYKQYTELCEPGGVRFLDFGVDPLFGHCVDGLVLVDLEKLKPRRRQRYFTPL